MSWRALVCAGLVGWLPLDVLAQEITIIPLEDLEDEPGGLTLQDLEDSGITLEVIPEGELGTGPLQTLSDEEFQSFEQETQVTAASAGSLRVLDKMTGVVTDVILDADGSEVVGRITVTLHECRYPTESPTSDAFVRLSVIGQGEAQLFDGWMVASSPALNALDHPRYDVWALRCASASETAAEGEIVDDIDDPLAAAEEAERPSGAVEVSLIPRPRPNR